MAFSADSLSSTEPCPERAIRPQERWWSVENWLSIYFQLHIQSLNSMVEIGNTRAPVPNWYVLIGKRPLLFTRAKKFRPILEILIRSNVILLSFARNIWMSVIFPPKININNRHVSMKYFNDSKVKFVMTLKTLQKL